MEMAIARMDGKGRVVIPKKIRERSGMSVNDVVFVYALEGLVCMRKARLDGGPVLENIEGLGLTALAPSREPRHSRELVIWALVRRPMMSFRQLRSVLKNRRGGISNQATWKLLRELMEEGQIKKLATNEYVINPEWIKELKRFAEVIEERQKAFQVFQ